MKIKRKTLVAIKKWTLIVSVVSVFLLAFYHYYKTQEFAITAYRLEGLEGEDVEGIVKDITQKSFNYSYYVFPNTKILTYSKSRIKEAILSHVPDIDSIYVYPADRHTLVVSVTRNVPVFRLDDGTAMTKDGNIFATTKDIHMLPVFSISSSTEEVVIVNGFTYKHIPGVDAQFIQNLTDFVSKVEAVIFPVKEISIDENDDMSIIDASSTSKIMLTRKADMKKVWSTLLSAIDTEPLKSKLKEDMADLAYLDVRFGNKVFYRFGAPLAGATSTAIIGNHDQISPVATTTER